MSVSPVNAPESSTKEQNTNFQAALARTLTRGIALYFSRPVRLFRPSKVSGWHSLRVLAAQHGTSLSPQYLMGLLKTQGFIVIPKHFIPPMLVNAFLGTVLWTTYAETSGIIGPHLTHHPIVVASVAGGVAGGAQALLAAPAENLRIILEGGSGGSSWSKAWQEVFRGTTATATSRKQEVEDIRRVRMWMKEVGGMAGQGWRGWRWGLGKDVCGFAAFFSIFELTRQLASRATNFCRCCLREEVPDQTKGNSMRNILPRVVHGVTLITGGVIAGLVYEKLSLPWDVARRIVHLNKITRPPGERSTIRVISEKLRADGLRSFFAEHGRASLHETHQHSYSVRRHLYNFLKTLGRVGPWGIGFLVWEVSGYGLAI